MRSYITLVAVFALAGEPLPAQDSKMQPIAVYLMPEAEEVALALSGGPASVSRDAAVHVLRRGGYAAVREGTNGFTCIVQRGWSSPLIAGAGRDFFDPRLRAPICYNRSASRTIFREYLRRTELALAGKTASEMRDVILAEIGSGELLPPLEPAMAYMFSEQQWLGQRVERWHPHIMLYVPFATAAAFGQHELESGLPLAFDHQGGPLASFVIEAKSVEGSTVKRQ